MSFCPHCHSGNDPVLKDTTWSCGVQFNDQDWRTKECYKRELFLNNEHIRLQEQHLQDAHLENKKLRERIERLVNAGSELMVWVGLDISDSNRRLLEDAWRKAMGAKP